MIIVNLTGGLGNQMFQYAFGKAIAVKQKTELKIHFTNALFNIPRLYELDILDISATQATRKDLNHFGIIQNRITNRIQYLIAERLSIQFNKHIVTQKFPYTFDAKYLSIKNNSYIQGYWQDVRYFESVKNMLRKEFTLKTKLDIKNRYILKNIQKSASVCVHVRRADYVSNKINIPKFVGLDYYVASFKKIKKNIPNPVFFIFSDDIPWCKKNFKFLTVKVYFIDNNKGRNSYKDLFLMSACKHNIIANSTFSWWSGWLNKNKDKIIISPNKTL